MKQKIRIGKNGFLNIPGMTEGAFVDIEGEEYYVIKNYDSMKPFFMSIVSSSDHWMYLSSSGSLTAGRANPEQAIFPYYTDDKIHDFSEVTGSKTIIQAELSNETFLWEPFSIRMEGIYDTCRNIYKNITGNKIIFEEVNNDLKLKFRYAWMNSEKYGWVRKSSIISNNSNIVRASIVDGIQNILPYGVSRIMQGMLSTLIDAYKKAELTEETGLAIYRLSSIPVDKAEPSEALKATIVWSDYKGEKKVLLSNNQFDKYRHGNEVSTEKESRGTKGSYFLNHKFDLAPGDNKTWHIVVEVCQDSADIIRLINYLNSAVDITADIEKDVEEGSNNLRFLVWKADGNQSTGDNREKWRHFSNTMFNIMRGGIPKDDYKILRANYTTHIKHFNRDLYQRNENWLFSLPEEFEYYELIEKSYDNGDPDIIRLSTEYLPLMFSRRHGDPSRPWNLFNIKLKNSDGTPSLYYQGNWRDIFQNWEALANTYPGYLSGMISRFLNATTIDGYNPYKITSDGFDWEILDPSDPWSNIGYWGDHQIIYLEKLLELQEKYFPGSIEKWMKQEIFTYANVPYRLKSYEEILKTPQDTILFDNEENSRIEKLVVEKGEDGKLLTSGKEILRSNFTVKALVPLLSKLSNFIPGAGVWMNTQRPEWNDANNALVGNGASMVTLYYIRRYVHFLTGLFKRTDIGEWLIPVEIYTLFGDIQNVLNNHKNLIEGKIDDKKRKNLLDGLGKAGSNFRDNVYKNVSGQLSILFKDELISFLRIVEEYIDHSINENKREDGLFNSYNLVSIKGDEVIIRHLYEMLEGQVAVLSSGYLTPEESSALLDKLSKSELYREDQNSYILYPDRQLPLFLNRNIIPEDQVLKSRVLLELQKKGNYEIVVQDENGQYHFNGEINNGNTLKERLDKVTKGDLEFKDEDINYVLKIYDDIFDHQSFTGRSGTFYKYEGLGCIYWHMVSKLLLATVENIIKAKQAGAGKLIIMNLVNHYNSIKEGIGTHKNPDEYGAFPTDPYSHTPSMAGVQQPGMTGQVKEDLITRLIEFGITINEGKIMFDPILLKKSDFIIKGESISPTIKFSFCGAEIIYSVGVKNNTVVEMSDGAKINFVSNILDEKTSTEVFLRKGNIKVVNVEIERLPSEIMKQQ